jgi:hypothetical protein
LDDHYFMKKLVDLDPNQPQKERVAQAVACIQVASEYLESRWESLSETARREVLDFLLKAARSSSDQCSRVASQPRRPATAL